MVRSPCPSSHFPRMVARWCTGRRAAAPTGRNSASATSPRGRTAAIICSGSSFRARPGRTTAQGSSTVATRSGLRVATVEVNRNQKVYYHKLGTDQAADRLIYERPDHPDWGFALEVSSDGRYAVYTVWLGTDRRNRIYYQDLGDPQHPRLDAP